MLLNNKILKLQDYKNHDLECSLQLKKQLNNLRNN